MPERPVPVRERPRATHIVATVGPASSDLAVLLRMIRAGTDVFRFNMSHGTHEEHAAAMARLREAAERAGRPAGILVDLQGPKLRTGSNAGGALVPLRAGESVRLEFRERGREGTGSRPGMIVIDQPALRGALGRGDEILLDDGRMRIRVEKAGRAGMTARVLRGGALKEHAGVNVPGRLESLRIPTVKDGRDAGFALEQGADFLALSFVQSAEDVARVRRMVRRKAGAGEALPLLIAKLEKPAALEHLEAILDVSDGVMVARGDLGVELSLEKVPLRQKEILHRARARGIYTITATQMLESMIESAVPTRAEVSDVANAVLDGTDALMLSAESAVGRWPVESVEMLARIAHETDSAWFGSVRPPGSDLDGVFEGPAVCEPADSPAGSGARAAGAERAGAERAGAGRANAEAGVRAVTRAAVEMAVRADARWIVVFTMTGRTVRHIARHRPPMPILALTPDEGTRRRLCLAWGTTSLLIPRAGSVEAMMRDGLRRISEERLARRGDILVLAAGAGHVPEAANLLRLVRV